MKTFVLVFTLLCALLVSANHKDPAYWRMVRKGVDAKVVLTVVDDLGSPVPDAAVHAIFSRTNDLDPLDGKTDARGKCAFQHLTNGNRLEFFISKDGYYGSQIRFTLGRLESCYYGRFRKLDYYLKRSGIGGASLRYEYNSVRNDTNLESKTYSGNVR